ncbi:hypothetical protein ACLOJK_014865 [Asimina triloba]
MIGGRNLNGGIIFYSHRFGDQSVLQQHCGSSEINDRKKICRSTIHKWRSTMRQQSGHSIKKKSSRINRHSRSIQAIDDVINGINSDIQAELINSSNVWAD